MLDRTAAETLTIPTRRFHQWPASQFGLHKGTKLTHHGRPSSRDKLLAAASQIVAEHGAGKLTLDAVAERAGVSKGGLLYNFPNKEVLLTAMIDGMIAHYVQSRDSHYQALPEQPYRFAKALLSSMVDMVSCDRQVAQGLLAVVSEQPELLNGVRAKIRDTVDQLKADSPDPTRALLAWLAIEGLTNMDILGINPLTQAERHWAIAAAHAILDGTAPTAPPLANR